MASTTTERQKKFQNKMRSIIAKYAQGFIDYAYLFPEAEAEEFIKKFSEAELDYINKILVGFES